MDEIDKHEWNRSYRRVQAVEELHETNYLLELYLKCYQNHYRAKPVWGLGNSHLTTIQDIKRLAQDKAPQLIQHFFKMKDQWFTRNCHSLDVLKKSINQVNTDYVNHGTAIVPSAPIKIQFFRTCIKCNEHNSWTGFLVEIESNEVCDKCRN